MTGRFAGGHIVPRPLRRPRAAEWRQHRRIQRRLAPRGRRAVTTSEDRAGRQCAGNSHRRCSTAQRNGSSPSRTVGDLGDPSAGAAWPGSGGRSTRLMRHVEPRVTPAAPLLGTNVTVITARWDAAFIAMLGRANQYNRLISNDKHHRNWNEGYIPPCSIHCYIGAQ